jgi:hypothetical protein
VLHDLDDFKWSADNIAILNKPVTVDEMLNDKAPCPDGYTSSRKAKSTGFLQPLIPLTPTTGLCLALGFNILPFLHFFLR